MVARPYALRARVSTNSPETVKAVLDRLIVGGTVLPGDDTGDFRVHAELVGESARELNRSLLSELRRAEKKTRLRSEWTRDGITERFFDYAPKGSRKA